MLFDGTRIIKSGSGCHGIPIILADPIAVSIDVHGFCHHASSVENKFSRPQVFDTLIRILPIIAPGAFVLRRSSAFVKALRDLQAFEVGNVVDSDELRDTAAREIGS